MKRKDIEKAFSRLNEALRTRGIKGEVGVVGGAAMVLAFDARDATKDVDAIFKPSAEIREAAREVAEDLHLPNDWLNDAVKGFLPGNPASKELIFEFDSLRVWVPPAEYLFPMKAISARFDSQDASDVLTLCKVLRIKSSAQAIKVVARYYPENKIPAKTSFFLEELLDKVVG